MLQTAMFVKLYLSDCFLRAVKHNNWTVVVEKQKKIPRDDRFAVASSRPSRSWSQVTEVASSDRVDYNLDSR